MQIESEAATGTCKKLIAVIASQTHLLFRSEEGKRAEQTRGWRVEIDKMISVACKSFLLHKFDAEIHLARMMNEKQRRDRSGAKMHE